MSIQHFPPECLRLIFQHLSCNDLRICRETCPEWTTVAREVSELKWKQQCECDFPIISKGAYKRSQLSWEQLYKSLRQWSQVHDSHIYINFSNALERDREPFEDLPKFTILENAIISYPRHEILTDDDVYYDYFFDYNTITHYDPETLKAINGFELEMAFTDYEENEILIALVNHDDELYVLSKTNINNKHCVGTIKLHCWSSNICFKYYLVQNKVFYIAEDSTLWMSVVINEFGAFSVDSAPVSPTKHASDMVCIAAFAYINDNQVNMLMKDGKVFSICNREIKLIGQIEINKYKRMEIAKHIKHYGFDWSCPHVYGWMKTISTLDGEWEKITHLKNALLCVYPPVVIIATSRLLLNIYYSPYDRNGNIKVSNRKPTLQIDLHDWIPHPFGHYEKKIHQIEVIEIENGHRILLLYASRLVSIEIYPKPQKRPGPSQESARVKPRCDDYVQME